ncbi:hypothetical protein PISL3812_03633 [Talaromyces islandicus]|uniref:Methyltransferase type 11 domain-containing protein n=1 Tax=Talaromyces islandicus TaxID=28573 RepID=A0A0U1LT82_TALIS|nr:hypothetical protein PISL3812_03633 [Talaromyces islandicus]
MSSHRFERVQPSRVVEGKPLIHDASLSSLQASAISKSVVVSSFKSHIPTPVNGSVDHRSRSLSNGRQDEHPVHPFGKTSRSLSSDDARPTGIPRINGNTSSSRRPSAPSIFASRASHFPAPAAPMNMPAPSIAKVENVENTKGRPRNVLRRKANFRQPKIDTDVAVEQQCSVSPVTHDDQNDHGGIDQRSQDTSSQEKSSMSLARLARMNIPKPAEPSAPQQQIPKELLGLRTVVNTQNLPPPTPIYAPSASPSTRYSGSPGMWSSRGSTPTSLSSYSPGIMQPATTGYRYKQSPVQTRQPTLQRTTTTPVSQTENDEPTFLGPIAGQSYTRQVKMNAGAGDQRSTLPRSPPPRKSSMKFKALQTSPTAQNVGVDISQRRADNEASSINIDTTSETKMTVNSSPARPRRPSRQGTDHLERTTSPIIRSNMTALRTTGHTRRESAEKLASPERLRGIPVAPAATSVESFQSTTSIKIPSRGQSPSRIPKRPTRTLVKSPKPQNEPGDTNATRKFGLFGKKSKTNLSKGDATDKSSRKGPAAGTGHEGYGKYAHRGRKSSVGSHGGPRARSSSTTGARSVASSKSGKQQLDIDDFLLDRLEPVVISGGGVDRDQLFRTHSGQSISSLSVTSAPDSSSIHAGPIMNGYSSDSLGTSMTDYTKQTSSPIGSDSYFPSQLENLHCMKSSVRNDSSPSLVSNTAGRRRGSNDTRAAPEESKISALPQISPASQKPDSAKKSTNMVSRKWNNFFHRSQKSDQKEHATVNKATTETPMHAKIAVLPNTRPVAHYALLDTDSETLEDILNQVEDSPLSDDEAVSPNTNPTLQVRHGTSVLLPSPPALWTEFSNGNNTNKNTKTQQTRPASPKAFFRKEEKSEPTESGKRSRLTSVGRIPQVVSREDRDHKPSSQSYSRPFGHDEGPLFNIDGQYSTGRPQLDLRTEFSHNQFSNTELGTPKPASAPVISESTKFASGAYAANEFLQFLPRKQSQVSSSTSEADSIMAAIASMGSRLDTACDTACEEDIWTEYDDLLDTVLTPSNDVTVKGQDIEPFEMVTKASKTLQAELNASKETTHVSALSDTLSVPVSDPPPRSSDVSVRLRRSQIATALHTSMSISPQTSYSELMAGYAERNTSTTDFTLPESPAVLPTIEDQSDEHQPPTPTKADFEITRRRNTMLFDMAERDREGPAAQTNLRSASLMTSRWLSFGRVLFSPAHNRMKESESERMLIIDGLGNDDWSYYCALTYPNATIYSLSIRPGSAVLPPHPDAWKPPMNHHLIHQPSISAAFPFPQNFFAVCILRFPPAYSEGGQRNIISECKRVLRPGGYLEMSVIDLDLLNVGSRGRKAVRTLKEKIFLADSDISLKPASDNIQRLLGTCGYDNLNRCMVSVPVAGMVGGSADSSNSSRSMAEHSLSSRASSSQPASTTGSQPHTRTPSDETGRSLGDLLSDPSPSATNDESITKMVARVGRWWYTRCYEIPVLEDPSNDRSIWAERKLLRECQKQGTGFRLLIAYAQKPSEKRRTVSV